MKRALTRAQTALRTAEHLLEYGDPVAVGSRAYFAVFEAMRAVLAQQQVDVAKIKTHHGLMLSFEQNVVKPGHLKRELATAVQRAAELRRVSDYEPDEDVPASDVRRTMQIVSSFIQACAKLMEERSGGTDGTR